MTVLYIQERSKRENENDGETIGQNQKTVVCPNDPFKGMNYTTAGKTGIQGRQFLVCFTDNLNMASDQTKTIYILSDGDFEFKLISKFSIHSSSMKLLHQGKMREKLALQVRFHSQISKSKKKHC
ncbi:uncharacterized protein LOC134236009 [Saccostrea cucullata]|uniref:uncharacterized protein LOC134236009 n=1 Tax=Saccostrea cuccullata TaxID=36930 RepID=UPI002ED28E80